MYNMCTASQVSSTIRMLVFFGSTILFEPFLVLFERFSGVFIVVVWVGAMALKRPCFCCPHLNYKVNVSISRMTKTLTDKV